MLYRPGEAAEAIGVSRSRMYELMSSGQIPWVEVGGVKRVPVDKLREWVERNTKGGPATE